MDLNWEKATEAERAVLYRGCKTLLFKRRTDWAWLRATAIGPNYRVGQGWERTFFSGRIGRSVAAKIYEWLVAAEPDLADTVRRDILALRGASPSSQRWEELLARSGRIGFLEIQRDPVERRHSCPDPDKGRRQQQKQIQMWKPLDTGPRIPIGVPFCINQNGSIDGAALGFQYVRDRWLGLPLDFQSFKALTYDGVASFPLYAGQIVPDQLYVEHEQGLHRIVVLTAPVEFVDEQLASLGATWKVSDGFLDKLAAALTNVPEHHFQLALLNAYFVS